MYTGIGAIGEYASYFDVGITREVAGYSLGIRSRTRSKNGYSFHLLCCVYNNRVVCAL